MQDWIARAAELKAELMARKKTDNTSPCPSMAPAPEKDAQDPASSFSSGANATATTIAPPATFNTVASTLHKTDEHRLKQDLKEQVDQLIAQEASNAQSLTVVDGQKLSPDTQPPFTPGLASSAPAKLSINTADHKDKGGETEKAVILQQVDLQKHRNANGSKEHQTLSSPKPDVDVSKDNVAQEEPKKRPVSSQTSKKKEGSDVQADPIPRNLREGLNALQDSNNTSSANQHITCSTPMSKLPLLALPAPNPPKQQVDLPPSKSALEGQMHSALDKPATKSAILTSKDEAPRSAPRDHKNNDRELQRYRPKMDPARVNEGQKFRGSTIRAMPAGPQLPNRSPSYYRQRDLDFDFDMLVSQNHDLKDWLVFTGWHNRDYRAAFLERKRRLADLDREKDEIDQERARLMSADEYALETARYRNGICGADDFKNDAFSRNTGKELFSSPLPSNRKRDYVSEYEDEFPRKMSRVDTRDHRRESSREGREEYGKRFYHRDEVEKGETTNHWLQSGSPFLWASRD